MSASSVVAAAGDITTSVANSILGQGIVGALLLVALFAVWQLFKREVRALERERERADRLETRLAELNDQVRDQYIDATNEYIQATRDAQAQLEEIERVPLPRPPYRPVRRDHR